MVLGWVSAACLGVTAAAALYWYVLVFGALLPLRHKPVGKPITRFAVTIPAHNEEDVITAALQSIHAAAYPPDTITVFVAADHCSDATAARARAAGAVVFERASGPRAGKGAALRWLFAQLQRYPARFDAIVVLDADSRIDAGFFQALDRCLQNGAQAVQGNHIISNPRDGWFPALTHAMFLIDNRFQNRGRAALGFSAKNMGDAICLRWDVMEQHGWGEGLTEDYAFRQTLLLHGIRISYTPDAKSYGQAPWTWQVAQQQRLRWLRGAQDASRASRAHLWWAGWHRRDPAILEAALQTVIPSYSTLTLVAGLGWLLHGLWLWRSPSAIALALLAGWSIVLALLFLYPLIGLALEGAPLRAFAAILSGPIFILWRTWLGLKARLSRTQQRWVRTPHRGAK